MTNLFTLCFQAKEPKASLRISEINVALVPDKVGHPNAMQILYSQDGHTRNIFVYSKDAKVWKICSRGFFVHSELHVLI